MSTDMLTRFLTRAVVAVVLTTLCPLAAAAQTVEYYHLDALGSVRAVTDQAGAVIERHDYLPFGEELSPPSGAQPLQFTGQERDAETGMDYFGARYYSGTRARFTTVDPALGIETALVDPQRWNRYAYVGNRPTKIVDPDGRGWLAAAAKLAKAAWTGQDYYSAVSGIVEGTATVFSMDAQVGTGDRLWATGSLLLELSGVADIGKGVNAVSNAVEVGRRGRQARLRELAGDPNVSSADRGWIQQDMNQIERGTRERIRVPPGKELAHDRGREAAKGYDYSYSNLQTRSGHQSQHRHDDFGRANRERPVK